ncbi:MAG: EF-hand domain-containing protein [Allosphingosinicella sp.]
MNSKMKLGLAAAAGAVALTAGGATLYAQGGGPRGPMAKFDSDSNGAITLAEARAGAARMFAGADADKDGRATHEEMMAFHGKMGDHPRGGHKGGHGGKGGPGGKGGKGPMHLDADGDGALTLAETQSGIDAHFAKMDSNRDGSIDEAEMRAAHEAHRGGR